MKKTSTLVLLALTLGCPGGDRKTHATAALVVAAQDLNAGRELALLDLSRATLPVECATPAVITADRISSLVGQSLVHNIPKGEPVRMQDVVQDLVCHHGPMAPVVAVTKDLKKGDRLSDENTSTRVIPEEQATKSVFRTLETVQDEHLDQHVDAWKKKILGRRLTVKQLHAGDVLRVSDLE
jgi:Flp pilus assembly protein CpaB